LSNSRVSAAAVVRFEFNFYLVSRLVAAFGRFWPLFREGDAGLSLRVGEFFIFFRAPGSWPLAPTASPDFLFFSRSRSSAARPVHAGEFFYFFRAADSGPPDGSMLRLMFLRYCMSVLHFSKRTANATAEAAVFAALDRYCSAVEIWTGGFVKATFIKCYL
jgi:hypothetical protein